jgi:hypothetical protein
MKTFLLNTSTKKLVWLAVACVLVVNAIILGRVFFNRSEVIATLQLSERELRFPYNYGLEKEDSSKRVSLRWTTLNSDPVSIHDSKWRWQFDNTLVISPAHYSSFQFPTCEKEKHQRYKKGAWVLLEFNGTSYADYVDKAEQYYTLVQNQEPTSASKLSEKDLKEKREDAEKFLQEAKNSATRLFVIDAAAERGSLEAAIQAQQISGHAKLLIVPAEVEANYNYQCNHAKNEEREIRITNLSVPSLYIPKDFAQDLTFNDEGKSNSSFTAVVNYGRLYEPWISSLKACEKDCE